MEVPFNNVSWERKVVNAGSFSGSIAVPGSSLGEDRLTTSEDHFDLYNSTLPGKNAIYIMRDEVLVWGGIIWSRDYDIKSRTVNVNALEFTSYLYHRILWKTFTIPDDGVTTVKDVLETIITVTTNDQIDQASIASPSDAHNMIDYYSITSNVATVTTEERHGFAVGDDIVINNLTLLDGERQVTSVDSTGRVFTFAFTHTNVGNTSVPIDSGAYAILSSTNTEIQNSVDINLTVDIDDALDNYVIVGSGDNNPFEFRGHTMRYVGEIIENFAKNGVPSESAITPIATVGTSSKRVIGKSLTSNVATITTSTAHGFSASNSVVIANVDSTFNGTYTISSTPSATTFTYAKTATDVTEKSVNSNSVSVRFDYYIEPVYNSSTYTFSNVFKAWLVQVDINKPTGTSSQGAELTALTGPSTVYGPTSLGANQLIFEHPGNIVSISLSENADSGSSRTWVVDSGNDLGNSATPYYGSYTNIPYLEEGYPMLETAVTDRNLPTDSDSEVVPYAKAIGYRLAPPVGTYKVTVNGSLSPKVNTYAPGDWCTVIPNDPFIDNRLKPPYENRIGLLVRKIASFRVTVPDNPAFPETVELDLVPEWEVS